MINDQCGIADAPEPQEQMVARYRERPLSGTDAGSRPDRSPQPSESAQMLRAQLIA